MPASRILILTAAFGEGHNSAARNLALGLERCGAECRVADPCMEASPLITRWLCSAYRFVTTHTPQIWYRIYVMTDKMDFSRRHSWLMGKPETYLATLIREFRPDAIVSTYPIYPYFLARILADYPHKPPVFTVITDSIEVNASWRKAPTDAWFVTDPLTRNVMMYAGAPPEKVIDSGFPVNPAFAEMTGVDRNDSPQPFRILYFPTAKKPFVRRVSRALLSASPDVQITIVLGKNTRLLYALAKEIQLEFPGRVKLIGWTKRVPTLLNTHHMVIGKAGGATVHEAIAAQCPMIVYHLVPGQEEGNLKLLESIGAGVLAETPIEITNIVVDLLADNAAQWRAMKKNMASHHRNAGALDAARAILNRIPDAAAGAAELES